MLKAKKISNLRVGLILFGLLNLITFQNCSPINPGSAGSSTNLASLKPTQSAPVISNFPLRIYCGSSPYTDSQGNAWSVDESFASKGSWIWQAPPTTIIDTSSNQVSPSDQALYKCEREGNPSVSYTFSLPNGNYSIKLKFAETYYSGPGQRVFDVSINGQEVLTDFDIYSEAGGKDIALDKTFSDISVSNGSLIISFFDVVKFSSVSAVEISPALIWGPEPGLDFDALATGTTSTDYGAQIWGISMSESPSNWKGPAGALLMPDITMEDCIRNNGNNCTGTTWPYIDSISQYFAPFLLTFNYTSPSGTVYKDVPASVQGGLAGFNFFNITRTAFLDNYIQHYIIPTIAPHSARPNPTDSNPLYLSIDGWDDAVNYPTYGILNPENPSQFLPGNGQTKGLVINPTAPTTQEAWNQDVAAMFKYWSQTYPQTLPCPHSGSIQPLTDFQMVYQYVDCLQTEWYPISGLHSYSSYTRNEVNAELTYHVGWFANQAPPVHGYRPRTLVWGVSVDNGDIHTSIAMYALVRSDNSYFAAATSGEVAIAPSTYMPVLTKLGSALGASNIRVTQVGISIGYDHYERDWPGGRCYLNMSGASTPWVISLPSGFTDWSGKAERSLSLADGKGDCALGSSKP